MNIAVETVGLEIMGLLSSQKVHGRIALKVDLDARVRFLHAIQGLRYLSKIFPNVEYCPPFAVVVQSREV